MVLGEGGIIGGIAALGVVGLAIYGRNHGWWCSGDHHAGDDYAAIDTES